MQDVGTALLAGSITGSYEGVAMLDHIILGCDDLDWGIALVEEHTGIGAAIGASIPAVARGTPSSRSESASTSRSWHRTQNNRACDNS